MILYGVVESVRRAMVEVKGLITIKINEIRSLNNKTSKYSATKNSPKEI